jgi:VanZ family protein
VAVLLFTLIPYFRNIWTGEAVWKKGGQNQLRFPFEHRVKNAGSLSLFRVFSALACLMTLVIFLFSLLPQDTSASQSSWLRDFLARVTGVEWDEFWVRKLAHFAEYALLGSFAGAALAQTAWQWKSAAAAWLLGFGIAFLDETLQLLSGRGPAILDVWIDAAGVLAGLAFSLLVFHLISQHRNK